ncbi:MAG: TonB-dependent siderophore receptor [Cyanobacteria bacterium P01_F01_bin.153]
MTDAAGARSPEEPSEAAIPQVNQLAQADGVITVTGLSVEPTDTGIQVVLETDGGTLAEPDSSRIIGNALVLEIPNAAPSRSDIEEFQPVDGIALIQVSELPGNRLQVSITGSDAPPTVSISSGTSGLTLAVTPGEAGTGDDDDAIQIGVVGDGEDDYYVPRASIGTRTDTPLLDVPQSVQVITQETLKDQGVIRLNDAIRNVSGAIAGEDDPRGQRYTLRGFDSASVVRNGVRLSNGGTNNIGFQELANVQRIEVLKGPASILVGSAEPGGVINLVTEEPLAEPRYEISFRGGNRSLVEPSIDFTGPLTEDGRIRYRINALYRNEEYIRDYDTPIERFFIAPVVAIDLDDDTDLIFEGEYSNDRRPGEFGLVAIGDQVADIPFDRALSDRDDVLTAESLRLGYRLEHRFSDDWKIRNSLYFNRYDTTVPASGASALVSAGFIPEFFNEETGDLTISPIRIDQPISNLEIQTNVVGEFSTGSIEHTLLAGVDLFRVWDRGSDTRAAFPPPIEVLNIFDPDYDALLETNFNSFPVLGRSTSRTDNIGVYIQDQVKLTDNLIVLGSLRFDYIYQESETLSPLGGGTTTSDQDESALTPRIGVVYKPSDNVSLYASYGQSFAPNTFTTAEGDLIEPEEGEQVEVGVRAEFLDGKLFANLALFNLVKDNVALPDPLFPIFFVPSGKQRSRGIELDIIGEILPGWNIVANYTYSDTEVLESTDGTTGNALFNAPEHIANLWTRYEIQSGSLKGLSLGVGLNYVGERFGDLDNSFTVDDYLLTNAAIAYEAENWSAGINFRNIFDIEYIEGVANRRDVDIYPGEGFTVIGSFSIRF